MLLETIVFVGWAWIIINTVIGFFSQSKTGLPRVGTEPGTFILRTWARWKWYKHGHQDVIRVYEQVRQHCGGDISHLQCALLITVHPVQRYELCHPNVDGRYHGARS